MNLTDSDLREIAREGKPSLSCSGTKLEGDLAREVLRLRRAMLKARARLEAWDTNDAYYILERALARKKVKRA